MAKDTIRDFSATASANTDIQSVNVDENCAASGINNAIRELMADLKDVSAGTVALETPQADSLGTDTISEKTSAAGVTIDGVLLKDGAIGSIANAVAAHLTSINGGQIGGARNLIINGNAAVSQRGTSFTNPANTAYTLDRWKVTRVDAGAVDISQSTEAPVGFYNSLKVDVTTADASVAASDMYMVYQLVEDNTARHLEIGTANAVFTSVSFWVKASKTGTYCVNIKTNDSTRAFVSEYTINSANTWEKKEVSLLLDTTGSWYSGNIALSLGFVIMAGTNYHISNETWTATSSNFAPATSNQVNGLDSTSNDWYITGVQLEVGNATPFEHESYAETLQKCQRYCIVYGGTHAYERVGTGLSNTTVKTVALVTFPVEMRSAPSITFSSASHWAVWNSSTVIAATGISGDSFSTKVSTLGVNVSSGLTAGKATQFLANNSTSARLIWSAEL